MAIQPISKAAVYAALTFIKTDDRDLWVRIAMAIKSEFGEDGFDMFDDWSSAAESYNAKAAKAVWKSVKPGGGVTIATLIDKAIQAGFDPKQHAPAAPLSDSDQERIKREKIERDRTAAEEIKSKHAAAAAEATKVWDSASKSGKSAYLERKLIEGHGARFVGDVLLVPLYDRHGDLCNLQRIYANGDKSFLEGGKVSGCFFLIGNLADAKWLLVSEGFATGATLHQATGRPVAVAFNTHNLKNVVKVLREIAQKSVQILLCADDDSETETRTGKNPGIVAASEAAKLINAFWCKPLALPSGGSDFNDLAVASGLPVVREQIETAILSSESAETDVAIAGQRAEKSKRGRAGTSSPSTAKKASNEPSSKPFFTVDERGVWFHGFDNRGEPLSAHWICSPLRITAKSRDALSGDWGYLLEFEDADGNPKRWAMPANLLAGDGTAYRSTLLSMGLLIGPGVVAKNQLTVYIQTEKTESRVRCVDKTGWHDAVYVLPDRTIGQGDEKVMFQAPGGVVSNFRQRGRLDQWRDEIGALCKGNSRLIFCVSAAFAAPLLYHSGLASGGFHIFGDSSSGKSTAFRVAGSVYGGKEYLKNWRQTDNSLEMVAAQHSDALLLLDEIAQVDPKVVGEVVYMLSNEQGKGRATQTATARKVQTWRVLFLSDGEVTLGNHMSEVGKGVRGGQSVRMAEIPADAGKDMGIYENLNDFADGSALSNHLMAMANQYHGTPGMAFIKHAVEHAEKLPNSLRVRVGNLAGELCPAGAHGQVARVAQRFALVGIAGELATNAGITGWGSGESIWAARICFDAWLAGRGGAGNVEHTSILQQVAAFFELHGDSRFTFWHRALDDRAPKTIQRAGFKRILTSVGKPINSHEDHGKEFGATIGPTDADEAELEYFVLPEIFRNEICKGHNPKTVAKLLVERGLLMPEGKGDKVRPDRNERLPGMGNTRCYRFTTKRGSVDE